MSRLNVRIVVLAALLLTLPIVADAQTCGGLVPTIVGTGGNDVLRGTSSDDVIAGLGGNDVIHGEGGNDVICGGAGNDQLFGGAGNDRLYGEDGNDVIHAGEGDDILDGGTGSNDVIHGGDGWDVCTNGKEHQCEATGGNRPPVADAGVDLTVGSGATVTLDGSRSSDADGDILTFRWSFLSVPAGSTPELSDARAVFPTFTVFLPGEYAIQLIVNDGTTDSAPDVVVVTTTNSRPVADAGPDRSAPVGETVTLDGSGSSDADGNPLTFRWSFSSVPPGSAAILSDAAAVRPTFVIDQAGIYVVELIVNDGFVDSGPDFVSAVTINSPPVAKAGPDQTALVGATVTLDGSSSSDVDHDPLTFRWAILSNPSGSTAALSDAAAVRPTLLIDRAGTYVVQLIVNDGIADSDADSVTISTINSPPVADAGPDQTTFVLDTVTLNGSGSSDVDGDALTFRWSLTAVPPGSTAALADATAVMPTMTIDAAGTYVAQLIVNDGTVDSAADTVTVTTENSAPVADAGDDQTVFAGTTVSLDGSRSRDVDGDALTFRWSLTSVPAGSTAALSDLTSSAPSFLVDLPGTYVAQLIVNDGRLDSAPDTVTISTRNSTPIADAGPDQEVFVGQVVALEGIGSRDADGDPLTYRWSFTMLPAGSAAVLSDPASPAPSFTADLHGTYVAQLIVNDGAVDSAPDTTTITTANRVPVASAGGNQTVDAGSTVRLDGSSSSDPDGDPLTFAWSFTSLPTGSSAVLSDAASASPSFVADIAGTFALRLVVNDGRSASPPSDVTITVEPPPLALTVLGTRLIGVGRTAQVQIALPTPAPAGGVTVTLTSEAPAVLAVGSPASVFIDPGATSGIASATGIAAGDAVLRASAPAYRDGTAAITVTNKLVELPETLSVNLAQQTNLVVGIAPDPAPPGGVTIQLTSSDESVIGVSAFVTIQPGEFSATAIVTGVRPGTATVTATNPDYATDTTRVSTAAQLNIVESSRTFYAGFPESFTVRLESGGVVVPAPSPGIDVTITPLDPDCATAPSMSIATGLSSVTAALTYGGTAALPCTTTLTASAPDVASDTITITVNPSPEIAFHGYPTTVGAGLHSTGTRYAVLGAAEHGGVTVRIASSNPAVALVSAAPTSIGTDFVDIPLADGVVNAVFVVHGVEGASGTATITASAPHFVGGTTSATVVTPAVRLSGLVATLDTLDPDDGFIVQIGIPNATGSDLLEVQNIRPGGTAAAVTVASSDPAVGEVLAGTASGAAVTVQIPPAQSSSALTFHPLSQGTTAVGSSAPGFSAVATSTKTVTVTTPRITFSGYPTTVGSGLHSTGTRYAVLGASQHGGVTVRIASSDPAVALVSPNAATPGAPFIDVALANGVANAVFVVHGLEGATGSATITASAPRFSSGSTSVTIVQPALRIAGLLTKLDTLDANDGFNVQLGIPNATASDLAEVQNVRPGGTPVTVTVSSSAPAVGEIVAGTSSGASVNVAIGPGQFAAALTFRQLSAGTTVVSAAAPGFVAAGTASVIVTVTTPGISFQGYPTTIGSGLHSTGTRYAVLGAAQHGGVTVRITSSDPAVALVSPNPTTPGTPFIDIALANGVVNAVFVVHGVENVSGTVGITASAPRFTNGGTSVTVVQPAVRLTGLLTSTEVFDVSDTFSAQIGVPNATLSDLAEVQNIRPGGTAASLTITSSNPVVGELTLGANTGSSVVATLAAGQSTVSNAAFRPLSAGTTSVNVTAPGFRGVGTSTVNVTVRTPVITFQGFPTTVGAGLHSNGTRLARLSASNHGGITVRVESSNPALALVSPNTATAGTTAIDVPLSNGQTDVVFVVHGIENATGNAVVTASAPGYLDGNSTVTIQPAALRFSGLLASGTSGGADDPFVVQIGIPNGTGTTLAEVQNVRPGSPGVTVTVVSSDPAVGSLVTTGGVSGTAALLIGANQSQTPTISFRPLARGSTLVTASAPNGVTTTDAGRLTVTVN